MNSSLLVEFSSHFPQNSDGGPVSQMMHRVIKNCFFLHRQNLNCLRDPAACFSEIVQNKICLLTIRRGNPAYSIEKRDSAPAASNSIDSRSSVTGMLTPDNSNSFQCNYTHFGVKAKGNYVVFPQVFQKDPPTVMQLNRTRRELSIDMAVGGPLLKTSENKTVPFYLFTP